MLGDLAFRYEAALNDGTPVSGVLASASSEAARAKLEASGLTVTRVEAQAQTSTTLQGDDLAAFNRQLSHLVESGLPLDRGLRVLAREMSAGRVRQASEALASDLERGVPLGEAFERHRGMFPSVYASLVDAGVKSGRLSTLLLNLSRHFELMRDLSRTLRRSLTYPVTVFLATMLVGLFLSMHVYPTMDRMMSEMQGTNSLRPLFGGSQPQRRRTPPIVYAARWLGYAMPGVAAVSTAGVVAAALIWPLLRRSGRDGVVLDRVLMRLPVVGRPMRLVALAGWCEALSVGVDAGLDLPESVRLAGQTTGLPSMIGDSQVLAQQLMTGAGVADLKLARLPATIPATIDLATRGSMLRDSLRSLAQLYERQARAAIDRVPTVLAPIMLIATALIIGTLLLAMVQPMFELIRGI
jgi:type IV pilus assembly protein PilC